MSTPHLPVDLDEVGMSTRLGLSLPLLALLVQAVAEADGPSNVLKVSHPVGAWIGITRTEPAADLTVSTKQGEDAIEPYGGGLHEALVAHGFARVAAHQSYSRVVSFATDDAFLDTARLIVGTFQHVYAADLRDHLDVELRLSAPSANQEADAR